MLYLLALLSAALPSALGLVRPDGVGKLPALGWNSWNAYGCNVDEQTVLEAAQKMVDLGLKDAGYEYVNIDDCWSVKSGRDNNTGRLVPDPNKFPDGIDGLATKVHNLGLKLGIYSAAGTQTCAGYPASLGHEELDAQTFADWGVDYLKYDNCNVPADQQDTCQFCNPDGSNGPNGTCTGNGYCPSGYDYSQSNTAKRFNTMRDALEKQSRTILYSLCEWGTADVNTWGNGTGNSWRSTDDINRNWDRIMAILNANSFYMNYVDFWGRPDPDMLEIGTNQAGKTGLSDTEQRSHFALWAAMKGPLITGSYFSNISDFSVSLLKNKYLLAFNQDDTYGKPAMPYKWGTNPDWTFDNAHPAEYWSGVSKAGTLVLAINTNSSNQTKNIRFNEIPSLNGGNSYEVTNVWSGSSVGCVSGGFDVMVESHDTAVYLVTGACSGKRDGFISKSFAA